MDEAENNDSEKYDLDHCGNAGDRLCNDDLCGIPADGESHGGRGAPGSGLHLYSD